jgi:hypothetical protein
MVVMGENTPAPVAPETTAGTHVDVAVDFEKLRLPISWVATIIVAIVGGVLSFALIYYRAEAHANDPTVHLGHESEEAGRVVTKKTLRRVLRSMTIKCEKTPNGEGLACGVTLPEEAD